MYALAGTLGLFALVALSTSGPRLRARGMSERTYSLLVVLAGVLALGSAAAGAYVQGRADGRTHAAPSAPN